MITGVVEGREARVPLRVHGPQDQTQFIIAVVDTGFTASLSLSPAQISELRLAWQGIGRGTLADGSECLFDVYKAEVLWDGELRGILIDEADTEPLLGMALLSGYELRMEVCPKGRVTIARLSATG